MKILMLYMYIMPQFNDPHMHHDQLSIIIMNTIMSLAQYSITYSNHVMPIAAVYHFKNMYRFNILCV